MKKALGGDANTARWL